ncbi:AAA family ATPase [Bradyrhizobium barranii subsp. apii]|uniref:AAA family ATPase n=1 Tax=Bradyrhizobium barranii subsp. apii TaxID=2819348 RepID=A0A8T5VM99_9BRAD|nr:AAA family ATPase [Bradyrhizobium barranii]UPT91407.1 AAA family ATPase [Bradyrhizobium barranii subsp. apii]
MTVLQLDKLSLTNFRCFADCDVSFHPKLTVLVAENGSGKTALLDAAAAALSVVVNVLYPPEWIRRIQSSDVRLSPDSSFKMVPQLPTAYQAQGIVDNTSVVWGSTARTYSSKLRPSRNFKQIWAIAKEFRSSTAILPLVAYYGTARLWRESRLTESRRSSLRNIDERVAAYADCLTSSSSFRGVSAWYESRVSQTASPIYRESLATNLAMIQGVKQATDTILAPTGWSDLHWDSDLHALTAQHAVKGRLPLLMLSDGVRTMLALVADVARRCVSLNPHLSDQAPVATPGVLIVDEVDMHLHPRWQQQVLGLLQSAFPALQIIVSTHSPHVLSTVDRESIRVVHLRNGQVEIETPGLQTRGVESADVLASVMGVDPIPQVKEAMDLSDYKAMIEDGKADTQPAQELRAKLIAHFGSSHPVLVDCDRLIRFQQFRLRREKPEGA